MKNFLVFVCFFLYQSQSFADHTWNIFLSSRLQCTSDLARAYYRGLFINIDSSQPNDWNLLPADGTKRQWFSSMVDICVRKSKLESVRSFVAHLILRHIQDARIASDGLGKAASQIFYTRDVLSSPTNPIFDKSVWGARWDLMTKKVVADPQNPKVDLNDMAKILDDRVNWLRPNFDVAFNRLMFLRYGFVKKGEQSELSYEQMVRLFGVKQLVSSRFGWNDIKQQLPYVAQLLEKTIQDMKNKQKALMINISNPNIEPSLP
jgi:hypothetical protein